MNPRLCMCSALVLVALAGCHRADPAAAPDGTSAPEAPATAAATQAGPSSKPFDPAQVPVSTATLGAFPYIGLPEGYVPLNPPEIRSADRFPVWTGDRFETVQGRTWSTYLGTTGGKEFSQDELALNIDSVVRDAGGVKVFEGRVPDAAVRQLGGDAVSAHATGLGDIGAQPSTVYLIRRADRNIWVYVNTFNAGGSMAVVESQPFTATAALLPAAQLKSSLDRDGKVALQVNFATDRTDILPDSQPQLAEVAQLLRSDPDLRLDVDGHTDSTGDAQHNLQLSEGRAKAVVAMLTANGIAADRLAAHGFGDSRPVDDNGTEAGKARNRRVELVKR